jgi:hypothetical protein
VCATSLSPTRSDQRPNRITTPPPPPLERKNECPRVEYPPWVLTHCHQPTPLYPLGSKGYIATLMIRSIITGRYLPKPPPLFPPSTVVVVICSIEWSERGSCHSSTADPSILIYTHWINHLKKHRVP